MGRQKSLKTHHLGTTTANQIQLWALQIYLLVSSTLSWFYFPVQSRGSRFSCSRILFFWPCSKLKKTGVIQQPTPKLKTSVWAALVIFTPVEPNLLLIATVTWAACFILCLNFKVITVWPKSWNPGQQISSGINYDKPQLKWSLKICWLNRKSVSTINQ